MKKAIAIALIMALVLSLSLLAACENPVDRAIDDAIREALGDEADSAAAGTAGSSSINEQQATVPDDEGGEEDNAGSNEGGGNDDASGGQAMGTLIKWMMDGTYSYDFIMISEGPDGTSEGTGSWAQDGNNFSNRQEMTVDGQKVKSWVMQLDGKMYVIDEESKLIMELSGAINLTEGMMTEYGGIALVGSGTGEINGKSLPYEEYKDDETGATIKYFMDGNDVYGYISEYEGYTVTMIITNSRNSVPAGTFDLPTGYTTMTF